VIKRTEQNAIGGFNIMLTALKVLCKTLRSIKIDVFLILKAMKFFPIYIIEKINYTQREDLASWPVNYFPILEDRHSESASLGEYFWQDLFVAKKIITSNPKRHIDVGSRIDGFIAHLACSRGVEVFDIRPLSAQIENVKFTQWDITKPEGKYFSISDCVTCLHTLEHIGLGRYGDVLDSKGWEKGLASLAQLLQPEGRLWISVPVGKQRVEFNAHRIFSPLTIIDSANKCNLNLEEFYYLEGENFNISKDWEQDMARLSQQNYMLAIFLFKR